jgi:hypothetical protein
MAIEQGFVMFVQAALAAQTPPCIVPGGYDSELEKDLISSAVRKAWAYRSILLKLPVQLQGSGIGFSEWTVQIDCHGFERADKLAMAKAIRLALRGSFRGAFPDPDATMVDSIIPLDSQVDGFAPANRTYVRSLEYQINYYQV